MIILPPLLFLTVFFLIPFAFAFKISLAETAPRVPPFTDILSHTPDGHLQLLEVAVTSSTAAVVLGTLAAIALVRFARFPGRLLLTGLVNAPLVMPEIITGITQLLLFVSMVQLLSWPHRGFTTIVLS